MKAEKIRKYIETIISSGITKGVQHLPEVNAEIEELERKTTEYEELKTLIKPNLIQRTDFNATGICPRCGNSLMKVYHRKHCGECSQTLDWEEQLKTCPLEKVESEGEIEST